MSGPNFFVAGAPKCGTSSLYHWLLSRPDVYLPHDADRYWRFKEPYHFSPDLVAPPHRVERDEYERLFAEGAGAPLRGEASAIYLFSDVAPARIFAEVPNARVVICLRHPAEFIIAFWRDCLLFGHDAEFDFARAIAPGRAADTIPAASWYPKLISYRRIAHFSVYVERFLETFPRDHIHFVWLDELRDDPHAAFSGVLDFLGAAPCTTRPSLEPRNAARPVRRILPLEQALESRLGRLPGGRTAFRAIERALALPFRDVGAQIPPAERAALFAEYEGEYARLREMTWNRGSIETPSALVSSHNT